MRLLGGIMMATRGFLTALVFFFLGIEARAGNPDTILSKEDAGAMFNLSRVAWEEKARHVKAAGMGDFAIAPTGEYALSMRPNPGGGKLLVTPSYKATNENAPWKLSVTVAGDEEPAFSYYMSMSPDVVKELIQKSAREMAPEYSVMGYMARNPNSTVAPSIHFTIFRAGDFPPVDMMNKMGKVCPPRGGKQVCVLSSMIEN